MHTDYKILNAVGRGMTSQVYRAQDPSGRIVAIKELLPEHRQDPKRLKGLEDEVALMRGLKHPNILALIEYDRDRYRMILEYMPASLRVLLQKGPYHYVLRLKIAMEGTEALAYLHERGIVHKDLKPENLFLTEDGSTKLGDFGFSERETGALGRFKSLFVARRIQGTISYLSPEQVSQRPLTVQSDIFSWGVVLYEMFTGHRPFDDPVTLGAPSGRGSYEVIQRILKADPVAPRELNGELEKELESLILVCLSMRRTTRPTALGLKSALRRIQARLR